MNKQEMREEVATKNRGGRSTQTQLSARTWLKNKQSILTRIQFDVADTVTNQQVESRFLFFDKKFLQRQFSNN